MCCREARKEQLLFSDIIWGWNWADNVTLWLPAYFSIFIYLDGIDREGSSEGMYTKAPVATVCIVLLLELLLPKPSIYLQSSHGRIGFTPGSSKPTFKKKLWPLFSCWGATLGSGEYSGNSFLISLHLPWYRLFYQLCVHCTPGLHYKKM